MKFKYIRFLMAFSIFLMFGCDKDEARAFTEYEDLEKWPEAFKAYEKGATIKRTYIEYDEDGAPHNLTGDKIVDKKHWKFLWEKSFFGYDFDMVSHSIWNWLLYETVALTLIC